MTWNDGGLWTVTVECNPEDLRDYTYVLMQDGLIVRPEWKHHVTRLSSCLTEATVLDAWNDCPIKGCRFLREHQASQFDEPGFRGAGTAVPVFSLRTSEDFGIGEFLDLKPLVDWAEETGQCIIQLLPVTDTTRKGQWCDSYPYSPISSFALHPMYLRVQALGWKPDAEFKALQKELNALEEIDYPKVFKAKMSFIRKAFEEVGEADMQKADYKKFVTENEYWLKEYAQFCAKRDNLEPEYYCWMQWHAEKQFGAVADYARSKGVSLKGDLPIGVSADSADAYFHPQLFNLDSSAGAPPDFFSADGQNWGFPTYNWEEMAKDDYAWWKSRLRKMARFFDAFRIDHILGFFRIWEIPTEYKSGRMGHFNPALPYSTEEIEAKGLPFDGLFLPDPRHEGCWQPMISPDTSALEQWQKDVFNGLYNDFFYHRHDEFWRRNAERKLPELLGATGMLACGEDLGMVPDCVSRVMDYEKILSLEMAMIEKGRPWPELSVCATSSHDMDTLRMQHGEMTPYEVEEVLRAHLSSASMLAIFPIQDWLALSEKLRRADYRAERVNHPEDPNHHWRYRLHLDVDLLTGPRSGGAAEVLRASIRRLLSEYDR